MTSKRRCSLSLLFAINCFFNLTWFILECHWYEMGHVIVRLRKFITPHATCRNSHVLGSESSLRVGLFREEEIRVRPYVLSLTTYFFLSKLVFFSFRAASRQL